MTRNQDGLEQWNRLTQKQRACLDLLVERKTSKEIARILDISKYTADQHLLKARRLLGTANRAQTAIRYVELHQTYHRMASHPVELPDQSVAMSPNVSDDDADALKGAIVPTEANPTFNGYVSLFRDFRRRDHSIYHRTLIMISMLVVMVIVLLAGLGIAQSLTRLISG